MRSGACALQQTLTAEAASVLKHSLSLARRRGHAQVTPLHVAATLLASRASLLRRACLKSKPPALASPSPHHPLQCRALELCFNVALNRLPTTPSGPLLHGQPSLSNALIAALKRAQAHQRRGCIEQQQQQPLLTIKVELEQLIISILDDPSVSRVMREAGFSSTAVKNNVEDSSASSVFHCYNSTTPGVFSSPCSPSNEHHPQIPGSFWQTHFLTYSCEQNPFLFSPPKRNIITESSPSLKEDIKLVLEVLSREKKRNTVIVGDSVALTEGLVSELMVRFERGEVPDELKKTHFIKFQFSPVSLKLMKQQEVDTNLMELRRKLDCVGSAIIYVGDLRWTIDERERSELVSGYYNPVEHLVGEIARLGGCENGGSSKSNKVWIMGTASYQTYMRCQMRQPPLELQWALQAVSVPSGGLGLSLHANNSRLILSPKSSQMVETKPFSTKDEPDKFTFCAECASHFEKEAHSFKSGDQKLPTWLQPQKVELLELKKKWNRLCYSLHQGRNNPHNQGLLLGKSYSCTSSSFPWWPNSQNTTVFPDPNSISFADSAPKIADHGSVPRFRRQQSCTIEFNFGNETGKEVEPRLDFLSSEGKEVKITLALGDSVFSDSGKWVEKKMEKTLERDEMCMILKENVPWQSETIPSIVEAVIGSESGKQQTWLLIQGNDSIGKRRLARGIAESVLGSADSLLHLNMNKRNHPTNTELETLSQSLKTNKKIVVLIEDIDLADTQLVKFLADCFETGKFGEMARKEGDIGRAIFVLTKGDSSSHEGNLKREDFIIQMALEVSETTRSHFEALHNLDHKRKAEWDISPSKSKNSRADQEKKEIKNLSRQSSFNTLDLNMKADEEGDRDYESEEKPGELSPISSDLTRETAADAQNPHGFVDTIENLFIFNQSPARECEMAEVFSTKMEERFGKICGKENVVRFRVEKSVLKEVCFGCGSFSNSLFEKWVKEIFETSLKKVKFGGKGGVVVRLCLGGGKEQGILEDGFMGSCLPNNIQVSCKD
ncbi:hypothetical protein UlMin_004698 [Ulmus minor]